MSFSPFDITTEAEFEEIALETFRFQYKNNPVFNEYVNRIGASGEPESLAGISYLPIQLFKSHEVKSFTGAAQTVFTSSSTTGTGISQHFVKDLNLYEESFTKAFEKVYGTIEDFLILALLPSYLEREGSSLVYMADKMVRKSRYSQSGFFLDNFSDLNQVLHKARQQNQPVLLLGVTFALLDFSEQFPSDLSSIIVMETGGMKGRRKELIRSEVHSILTRQFKCREIHSEYGMTELLSQAYSTGHGLFRCPPWMKVQIRNTSDPFEILGNNRTGGINVIDLANRDSCSFIATQDLGKIKDDGSFEILGRFDNSDIRGCNLLAL